MSTEAAVAEAPGTVEATKFEGNDPTAFQRFLSSMPVKTPVVESDAAAPVSAAPIAAAAAVDNQSAVASSEPVSNTDDDTDLPELIRGKSAPLAIDSIENGNAVLKEKFGLDLSIPESFQTLTDKLQEAETYKTKAESATTEHQKILSDIANLSPVTKALIQAELNGQDPHTAYEISVGKQVDYTMPIKDISEETLIRVLASDLINVEDYEDDPTAPTSKAALEAAKSRFVQNQVQYNKTQETAKAKADNEVAVFEASLNTAIATALKSLPNPDAAEVKSFIEKVKTESLAPLFFNPDNTMKSDAVEKAFYAENGKKIIHDLVSTIGKLKSSVKNQGKVAADAISSLPKTPTPGAGVTPEITNDAGAMQGMLDSVKAKAGVK